MMATRGHKTGKKDDGSGNQRRRLQDDLYEQMNVEYFYLVKVFLVMYE